MKSNSFYKKGHVILTKKYFNNYIDKKDNKRYFTEIERHKR